MKKEETYASFRGKMTGKNLNYVNLQNIIIEVSHL